MTDDGARTGLWAGEKIFFSGRLAGLTLRRAGMLARARGASIVRRPAAASLIVVAHAHAAGWSDEATAALPEPALGELAFRRGVGLAPALPEEARPFSRRQIAAHAGLPEMTVRSLALFDMLDEADGQFGFRDMAVAREARRLLDGGVPLPAVLQTGARLRLQGERLNAAALRQTPWGSLAVVRGSALATVEGQFELQLAEPRTRADEIFEVAAESEVEGDLAEAERLYRLASTINPRDALALFNLGNVLAKLNRPDEAVVAFLSASARDAGVAADCHYNIGIIHYLRGDARRAERCYRTALGLDAAHPDALNNLALLLGQEARWGEALPLWDRLAGMGHAGAKRQAALCRMELVSRRSA